MRALGGLLIVLLLGCANDDKSNASLFTDVTYQSGIKFFNQLTFTEKLNPYTYRNFYNGAGVAIGDINNDGLLDIYFAGNQVDNKLYLNEGDFKFRDITEAAGVACKAVWSSGVTFVDINADGLLDIYVCKSGSPDTPNRNNELFVNNGDLTFTEKSKEYGLDIIGLSVQAAFFDYDKDGDLDCYLLTNSFKPVGNYDLIKDQRRIPDPLGGGNKFYLNNNGKFLDYSEKAGIYRSNIGFGLGITLGDFNDDTWTDIFISNDFFERDYLYINDQHGSFKESLTEYFQSISMGSMGADFADLDNDGKGELFVTEMLPDSLSRKKTKTVYENWNKYQLNVKNGYHHQFSRNVLQKKASGHNYFELGRLASVSSSEWSWGALLFDMNNDGNRDIFIANGIYKDLLDRDYLTYTGAEDNVRKMMREEKDAIVKLIDLMPASQFPNYAFENEGHLRFKNMASVWGLDKPMYSSGSSYGDLDNDGDLDLVVNNINGPSAVYRNNSDSSLFRSISVVLSSKTKNTFQIGSEIKIFSKGNVYYADNFVTRGFQSSVQPFITMGLGKDIKFIDSLVIKWPDGGYTSMYKIKVNQKLIVNKEDVEVYDQYNNRSTGSFELTLMDSSLFRHKGSGLVDFNRDRLLPMMYSNETPSIIKGDIDKNGIDEVYVGGGRDQPGSFIKFKDSKWEAFSSKAISKYSLAEETRNAFVDVDGDNDLDLYMASGGRFFPKTSSVLIDKLFINDGKGNFSESLNLLPFKEFVSTSVVKSIDFDNDGDNDLLIGERFDPFIYGRGGRGYLFENDGKGKFKDVTGERAPTLLKIGMVTDAEVEDINGDGLKDIQLVGDWMPIVILKNDGRRFLDASAEMGMQNTEGWWHDIEHGDFNKDGKVDFILGNHGWNTFFKPDDRMYVNDFDQNGSTEQIFCTKINEKYYPIVDRDEFLSQLPSLKRKLLYYKDYGKKSIDELLDESVLNKSKIFQLKLLSSVLLLSDEKSYNRIDLPLEGQYSPIYSLVVSDFDNDGIEDVIAGGNQYGVKPQFGRHDASHGWFFKGVINAGKFSLAPGTDLNVRGEIRDIEYININKTKYLFFAKYDNDLEVYKIPH
jgi:hypothetical protein